MNSEFDRIWNDIKSNYNLTTSISYGRGDNWRGYYEWTSNTIVIPIQTKMLGIDVPYMIHEAIHAALKHKVNIHDEQFITLENSLLKRYGVRGIHRYTEGVAILKRKR